MEYRPSFLEVIGLDVCRPRTSNLAPLPGFVGDELAEVGRRERKPYVAKVGKPRLDLGIGEAGIDLLVELVDDFSGVSLGAPTPYQVLDS